jgi:hypothetical protein
MPLAFDKVKCEVSSPIHESYDYNPVWNSRTQAMSFESSSLLFPLSVSEVCKKSILVLYNSFFPSLT